MCTLIVGQDVLEPGSVILAGNRDEDPARPSRPPGVLREQPRLVGGSDARAGGTWMAIRERSCAIAMLNRWNADRVESQRTIVAGAETGGAAAAPPAAGIPLRSRGLLALDVAAADDPRGVARAAVRAARYAPFSCVCASPAGSWVLAHRGGADPTSTSADTLTTITAGWHVLTHRNLDDPDEPRTSHLISVLRDFRPSSVDEARARLMALLASHGPPAVCIHEGRMVTVSSFVVWLAPDAAQFHHLDGRPCERTLVDFSHLLAGAPGAGNSA